MEMIEVLDKLKELQDVLAQKYEIETKIAEAPKKLSNQEELLGRLKKEFIEKNEAYEKARSKVAHLKTELADTEMHRDKSEKAIAESTTNREYEALEKEIKDATEKEQQLRKDLQEAEKVFGALDEELKQREQLINQQETELNEGKENLNAEIASLNAELDALKKEEAEITPDIDHNIVFKFERIVKNKHGKGIVAVQGNVCDGCHMILPGQFANEVRDGKEIKFCPYCSRILFYEEDENAEQYYQLNDTGSLVDLDDDERDEEDGELDEYDEDGRHSRDDALHGYDE